MANKNLGGSEPLVEQIENKVKIASASAPAWRMPAWPLELTRALSNRRELVAMAGLSLAIGLGLLARLRHIVPLDFPLNDGGMFYAMVRDIQANHYVLPSHTTYNSYSIPFAYPPLPFYLAAVIDDLTPMSLAEVLRFLPLIANVLTIAVVYYFARRLLGTRTPAPELAAIIFALLPRGYRWLIMGGGLTRSLAFLFALVALHQAYLSLKERKTAHLAGAAAFGALTVLSHPEAAYYLLYSFGALLLCYGLRRQSLIDSFVLFTAVVLLTAPWWASTLARDGLAPFQSAARTGGQSWEIWRVFFYWDFTELSVLNWPAMLALLGVIVCISRGDLFLPIWLVVSVVLEPRSAPTFAMPPTAILAAVAIAHFVLPIAQNPVPAALRLEAVPLRLPPQRKDILPWLHESGPPMLRRGAPVLAVGAFVFFLGFLSIREVLLYDPVLTGVTAQDRAAFQWVSENTPSNSRFLVVSGDYNPFTDKVSEWFPALTGRQSVATLQGFEWLGEKRYIRQWDNFDYLQSCQNVYCLDSWTAENKATATYVYVTRDCCADLELSLRSSRSYTLQYAGAGASIFLRKSSGISSPVAAGAS